MKSRSFLTYIIKRSHISKNELFEVANKEEYLYVTDSHQQSSGGQHFSNINGLRPTFFWIICTVVNKLDLSDGIGASVCNRQSPTVKWRSAFFKYKWPKAHIFLNNLHGGKQTGSIWWDRTRKQLLVKIVYHKIRQKISQVSKQVSACQRNFSVGLLD